MSTQDGEIPEEFVCPITQSVFKNPVMDMQGRTYERNAILSWLAANGTCPLTRRTMKASDLIPNVMMQTRIRLWQRETGQEVFPTRRWDGMKDVFGYGGGEDSTEGESGSDNDTDEFSSQAPVYAITIVTPEERQQQQQERQHRSSRHSRSSRRRNHQDRTERNRPVEAPTPSTTAPPRRFRLFRRRGSL